MERSTRITLVYALAFFTFLIVPVAFRSQAPWPFPPGVYWQEAIDLLTPLVLIPLSWLLCSFEDRQIPANRTERLVFLVLAALWVEGQAMHLAANSIGRPWESALSPSGELAHYYDEVLSHYLWHLAIAGISALAIVRSLAHPYSEGRLRLALAVPAALLLGVTWFVVVIEGETGPMAIPFTMIALAFILLQGRANLRSAPVAAILGGGYAVALVLMSLWAAIWRGLPPFTEVGSL